VTRARIVKLARDGMTRNAIAREVGVGTGTVSRVCNAAEPPISFERTQTATAVAAHSYDVRAKRARLSDRMLAKAHELLDFTEQPHEITHWDKDGELHRATIHRPTAADMQKYLLAAAIATDKHITLDRIGNDERDSAMVDAFLWCVSGGIMGVQPAHERA
jgi:IS30 family transposase